LSVSSRLPDVVPPSRPLLKKVNYVENNVLVEWIPNTEPDLAGYNFFRADTLKEFEKMNVNLLGRSTYRYIDRTCNSNTTYYYRLAAVDSAGNTSSFSRELFARWVSRNNDPIGEINLKGKFNKRRHESRITWSYSGKKKVTGFVVYAGEHSGQLRPVSGVIQGNRFRDSKASGGKYYQVRVYLGPEIGYSAIVELK
jgi:hypothetical protein